jgi:hypothetical protein
MSYRDLPASYRAAYFVGRQASFRNHFMDMARTSHAPEVSAANVKNARHFNWELVKWLKITRDRMALEGDRMRPIIAENDRLRADNDRLQQRLIRLSEVA